MDNKNTLPKELINELESFRMAGSFFDEDDFLIGLSKRYSVDVDLIKLKYIQMNPALYEKHLQSIGLKLANAIKRIDELSYMTVADITDLYDSLNSLKPGTSFRDFTNNKIILGILSIELEYSAKKLFTDKYDLVINYKVYNKHVISELSFLTKSIEINLKRFETGFNDKSEMINIMESFYKSCSILFPCSDFLILVNGKTDNSFNNN